MSRDRDTLAGLNSADITTQVVFQFADPCRGHLMIIATCGHILQERTPRRAGSAGLGTSISLSGTRPLARGQAASDPPNAVRRRPRSILSVDCVGIERVR